jgi:uncharacterized protein DUF6272
MTDPSTYFKAEISDQTILALHGIFDEQRIQEFIRLVEKKLEKQEKNLKIKKKVVHIMVEILQNVYHHANETCAHSINAYLVISKDGEAYLLSSGNFMPSGEVDLFKQKIEDANNMTQTELKSKYINTLDKGTFSVKGGAGLGILDIVRRSGNKVSCQFVQENNLITFFMLKVKVTS